MNCRVCGDSSARATGVVEYIAGYARTVFDCTACGCRFTQHDDAVHDTLHQSGAISYYSDYRELAAQSKRLFDLRDLSGLHRFLSTSPKYRFIIEELDRAWANARILEIGCSRGYLTSYFILRGRKILGVDVSSAAIASANMTFGPHFALADSPEIQSGAPYDFIYHVGMIGCVADPVGFTRKLLALLKPGGRLIFNAPNFAACRFRNQLWFDSAPPPDVVTLYRPGFWQQQFSPVAVVREGIEALGADSSFVLGLRRRFGPAWRPPGPVSMTEGARAGTRKPNLSDRMWKQIDRAAGKFGRLTRLSKLARPWPTEFGLYVKMTPRHTPEAFSNREQP